MSQAWAKSFMNSKAWRLCRNSYIAERIAIDGGLCEQCHINLGYIVHHTIKLTPENIYNPDISLNHFNLMYVCKKCHDEYPGHGVGKRITPKIYFDDKGMPIPP